MQNLTAPPRDSLTAAQVTTLLTGDRLSVAAGLELLDTNNNLVSDITADFVSGSVDRQNFATVHGTCKLVIARQLAWGKDRVRPYMTLSNAGISARFNLGVFVMTTPDSIRNETPLSYDVSGFDLLYLLQAGPSDTYVVASGVTYLAAVQGVLTASGVGVGVSLDGTSGATTLPSPMVWCLDPTNPESWLSIINDLLSAISYRGLWANENGTFRSAPYVNPSVRTVEWTLDTSNNKTNLVGDNRKLISDVYGSKNQWKFVRTQMSVQPIIGAGIYIVDNPSTGRTSQAALGRIVRAPAQFLTAADQPSLVAQGDAIVAANQAISRQFEINVDPLPIAGHFDVIQFNDAGDSDKCQVSAWNLPLDGSPGKWTLASVNV